MRKRPPMECRVPVDGAKGGSGNAGAFRRLLSRDCEKHADPGQARGYMGTLFGCEAALWVAWRSLEDDASSWWRRVYAGGTAGGHWHHRGADGDPVAGAQSRAGERESGFVSVERAAVDDGDDHVRK